MVDHERMTKMLLVVFIGLLQNCILLINAECNSNTDVKQNSEDAEVKPLHHIIEFGKRDQIRVNDCIKKDHTNTKNSSKSPSVLGLHGILHARSQKAKQQTGTRREDEPSRYEALIFEKPKETEGIKRTEDEEKRLHKLQLRAETIRMLHKIVEKYFPSNHLTVEQKIKALKILGKLLKLKKEGTNADTKAIVDSFAKAPHNSLKDKGVGGLPLKNATQEKVPESGDKVSMNNEEDDGGGAHGGDIYATIANGPDMPKMPPTVDEKLKDPEHVHSNIMPVGVKSMDYGGGLMSSIDHPNHISDQMGDFSSERMENSWPHYSNQQYPGASPGMGQIYNSENSYYNDNNELGGLSDVRRSMPFSQRYRNRGSYDDEDNRSFDDYDEDDDDGNDDDDDDDDGSDDEEPGHTRSYVNRHDYDDDDSDDDNVVEYHSRFNRKNKIAKSPKKRINALV